MEQQSIFGESATKKRTPPPAWVVRKLVARGVPHATAAGYDNRQAFAVLQRKLDESESVARPDEVPEPYRGASFPERVEAADQLRLAVADDMPAERLADVIESTLYTLPHAALVRVAKGVEKVLRESCQ